MKESEEIMKSLFHDMNDPAIMRYFYSSIISYELIETIPQTHKFFRGKASESFDNHILQCKLVEVTR